MARAAKPLTRRCQRCGCLIRFEIDVERYACDCAWITLEHVYVRGLYDFWVYDSTPAPKPDPVDHGKCGKCGKDLEFIGLNRTYPPKLDIRGRPICPHCGYIPDNISYTPPSYPVGGNDREDDIDSNQAGS